MDTITPEKLDQTLIAMGIKLEKPPIYRQFKKKFEREYFFPITDLWTVSMGITNFLTAHRINEVLVFHEPTMPEMLPAIINIEVLQAFLDKHHSIFTNTYVSNKEFTWTVTIVPDKGISLAGDRNTLEEFTEFYKDKIQ